MNIEVAYKPERLTYSEFALAVTQCFPYEPFNIDLFNEMQLNHFWIVKSYIDIIGYAYLREENDNMHLSTIGIIPSERGKGYSKLLMDRIIGLAGEKGIKLITLSVQTDNTPAMKLYKEYGFYETTSRYQYIVPVKHVFSTLKCDTTILAVVRNVDEIRDGAPRRYKIDFTINEVTCGNCRLDPDFPGCSSYTIDSPETYFISSLHALKEHLIPGTENLILTFSDCTLRDACEKYKFKRNYVLTDMELRIGKRNDEHSRQHPQTKAAKCLFHLGRQ